jgi:ferredoxin-nitrate reductase
LLLTGAIGKPSAGPLVMAGQPSAMCNRETGAGGTFPAYRNPHNETHMRELCDIWNINYETFCRDDADDILQMMEKAERGEIEFMWVIGTNPVVSLPDRLRTERILRKLFVVVQDPFIDTETVEFADIYLPAAMWGEKMGCVTNADRSVNLLQKAVEPPGQARSDFEIFVDVANRLGMKDKDGLPFIAFNEPQDAFEEWRRVSKGRPCDYSGMAYELLREMGAARWPCNEKHPRGAERLYEDLKFNTGIDDCEGFGVDFLTGTKTTRSDYARRDPKGKAKLIPVHWRRPPNPVTDEFPLLLNTGRLATSISLPHPHQDRAFGGAKRTRARSLCGDTSRRCSGAGNRSGRRGGALFPARTHGSDRDRGGYGEARRVVRAVPLWARQPDGERTHLVRTRRREAAAL